MRLINSFLCLVLLVNLVDVDAARKSKRRRGKMDESAKQEYLASDMLSRGLELIKLKQEDRGLKLVESIEKQFPKSKTRFKAYNALGEIFMAKKEYDKSVIQFKKAMESEEDEYASKAMYLAGICYYNMNKFDNAFVILRKVINEYPWSIYANESYYYIGLCHFKLRRWSKAVDALNMVGTSVDSKGDYILTEAGQRYFTKLSDKDLIVLANEGKNFSIQVKSKSGDEETVTMENLGKSTTDYLGSLPTKPGGAKPGDGVLQIIGGDTVTSYYIDNQTEDGTPDRKTLAKAKMVSTATIGFTDGAYKNYNKGIFANNKFFMRVKDLDLDTSGERDVCTVKVYSTYKVEKEFDPEQGGVSFEEEEEWMVRSESEFVLEESGNHSGVFVGSAEAFIEGEYTAQGDRVEVKAGDTIVLEYIDLSHIEGEFEKKLEYKAKLLVGEIQDVKIERREAPTIEMKAQKNLIEAEIFLRLAEIFKEVGLKDNAYTKADDGLDKVETVISIGIRAGLDRKIVERAFNVKWDLYLAKDKLGAAITTCNQLISLFPDSVLVDQALMKIGKAKLEEDTAESIKEALQIFNGITRLKVSALKAEASYYIAEVQEKQATKNATKNKKGKPVLEPAMLSYKRCAENYPESPFAGKALEKIANYYVYVAKDYQRALDLMDQIFEEHPDASFLDAMLIKWVVAAYRKGQLQLALEKCEQLIGEYPQSSYAAKAEKFRKVISRKLN